MKGQGISWQMIMVRMEERAVEMAVVSKDYPLLVEVTL